MKKVEIYFEFEKATKNTVRFSEVPKEGQAPIVGSLYIHKSAAGDAKKLKVTIEGGE